MEDCDYLRFPTKEFQLTWLHSYLEMWKKHSGSSETVCDTEIEELYKNVTKFTLVSHIFWILWNFIQAQHSTIDFDFLR